MTKKHKRKKKIILIAVMALVVLAGVVLATRHYGVIDFGSSDNHASTSQPSSTTEEKVAQLKEKASTAASDKETATVQKELTTLANQASSKTDKQTYLHTSVELYINNGAPKQALPVAKQAEDIESTALTAADLAYTYMSLGDFKKAAEYYQTAADRSEKTDDPTVRVPYNDYMILKREAEAQQS